MEVHRVASGLLLLAVLSLLAPPAIAQTFIDVTEVTGADVGPQTAFGNPTWVDLDADGILDLFVVNHGGVPTLLRNRGDGTFKNVRPRSGISTTGDRHGAAWGDYNNDGLPDLFITLGAERASALGDKTDQLYRNDGDGHFTEVAGIAGVENRFGRGRSVNWIDYDNDGLLDLFIKNFDTPNVLYRNNGDGTFTDVAEAAGLAAAPGTIASWADYDGDGHVDLVVTAPAGPDRLYRNNGDGTFTDVTKRAGLATRGGRFNGAGVAWGDYNGDGLLDLYIARGRLRESRWMTSDSSRIVFSAEETGTQNGLDFTVSGGPIIVDLFLNGCRDPLRVFLGHAATPASDLPVNPTWQSAWGHPAYTEGVDLGFYVWKDNRGWHLRWNSDGRPNGEQAQTFQGVVTTTGVIESVTWLKAPDPPSHGGGTLYRNNGDGTFTDVTVAAGVVTDTDNRAAMWGDADNDGHLDLYVVGRSGRNFLFHNNGDGTFTEIAETAGVLAATGAHGEGAAWGDYDRDGFLDLLVTQTGRDVLAVPVPRTVDDETKMCLPLDGYRLYQNTGNLNGWLNVRLVGSSSPRDGLGASVWLRIGDRWQYRFVNGGGGGEFFSQGSGPVHFGLGMAPEVDTLIVMWPSGKMNVRSHLAPNQTVTIRER